MSTIDTISTLSLRIKQLKRALKTSEQDPFMFKDEEIRYMKTKLREMYAERRELNSGNGFG
tara:strand:- start:1618 stop:1800 length:183 start_codon:yes stop_codon:yes gene_type:complete